MNADMRLFTAVELGDEAKDTVYAAVRALAAQSHGGVFTRRDNLHLTLVFIGETARLDDAKAALGDICAAPFELSFGGAGRFARPGGDVVWLGVERSAALAELQRRTADALRSHGFPVEDRPYAPHLTLGRQVFPDDLSSFGAAVPHLRMRVEGVSLMRSQRTPAGLVYSRVGYRALG